MGRRGPAPLPTEIKRRRGTLEAQRENRLEPTYDGPAEMAPPATLTGRGLAEWVARIGDAAALGVVQMPDLPTLQLYCEALNSLEWIESRIVKVRGDKRLVYIDRKNKLLGQFRNLARELGFTPSSRSGVKASEKKPESKLDAFQRGPLRVVDGGKG